MSESGGLEFDSWLCHSKAVTLGLLFNLSLKFLIKNMRLISLPFQGCGEHQVRKLRWITSAVPGIDSVFT